LAGLTSFTAKGTIEGYDTYLVKVPVEVYARAPHQRTIISHTQNRDNTTVFDGQNGWIAAVDKPLPLLPLLPGANSTERDSMPTCVFPRGSNRS
jgi:hypothetical protein